MRADDTLLGTLIGYWNGTALLPWAADTEQVAGTAQTARDIGASVLLSSGTGTGQLSITSGVVAANATQISGDSTAADNAEAFFDGTGYAGTNNVIPTVTTTGTATNLTNLPAAAATAAELAKVPKSDSNVSWNATALAALQQEATDALNAYDPPTNAEMIARTLVAASYFDPAADTVAAVTTVGSVTGAVGSVTGAVGSVTGAVGSVTGNVGGNVTGSVGSVVGDTKQTADVATLITTVGVAGAGLTALATAAALDAVDNFLDTEVAAILADTNELQTDWTNGGRLDLLLDGATAPSAADIKTALEANGSKLDHLWEMTEDDGGVRRLTANALEEAPTGGSAPTAATIADAVWDELSTGHTSAGKAGEQLWTDIDAIKGRTDTIGALTVTLTAPVATSGNAITVIRGDDYLNADGRALAFTGTNWPVITGGAVALIVRFPTVTSYTGVVTGAAACYIELTDTQTALLTPGVYDYDLQATLAGVGGSVITLAQGTFTVSADVR